MWDASDDGTVKGGPADARAVQSAPALLTPKASDGAADGGGGAQEEHDAFATAAAQQATLEEAFAQQSGFVPPPSWLRWAVCLLRCGYSGVPRLSTTLTRAVWLLVYCHVTAASLKPRTAWLGCRPGCYKHMPA